MKINLKAKPYELSIDIKSCAILMIDMQKDFVLPGGFGESLGNDVSQLEAAVAPCKQLLDFARDRDMLVVHTREGHRHNLSDVFQSKLERCKPTAKIGDEGPMGRILIRGENGHDFVDELQPVESEVVIEKPGKGAFYSTELDLILRRANITDLLVAGVTTEVCVSSTVREANDRGYNCIVIDECCASYFPDFHQSALEMIAAQGGIFGFVSTITDLNRAIGTNCASSD